MLVPWPGSGGAEGAKGRGQAAVAHLGAEDAGAGPDVVVGCDIGVDGR
jgi:hypothetical protein